MSKSYCPNCGNALGNLRVIDGSCYSGDEMTAFDEAWDLVKAPFRGTSSKWYDQAMEQGVIPAIQTEKDRKGVWATNKWNEAKTYAMGASSDQAPLVHHLPEHIEGVGDFDEYRDYGYYPFDVPAEHSKEVWRGVSYDDWRKERMQAILEAQDAGNYPTPKMPNITRWANAMRPLADAAFERWRE